LTSRVATIFSRWAVLRGIYLEEIQEE